MKLPAPSYVSEKVTALQSPFKIFVCVYVCVCVAIYKHVCIPTFSLVSIILFCVALYSCCAYISEVCMCIFAHVWVCLGSMKIVTHLSAVLKRTPLLKPTWNLGHKLDLKQG